MLMIRAKIRAAPMGRATTKKVNTSSDVLYTRGYHFVLVCELVAEKTGLFGREDLFLVLTDFGGTRANPYIVQGYR